MGFKGGISRVKIELLLTEGQCATAGAESNGLHTESASVKRDRGLYIADGQHQVIETFNFHCLSLCLTTGFTGKT